ncbi:hypothetical protein BGX33_006682 [Mortierella sp. NVP41]|nr:hypothetical protein BGX33_006682 [Mortierella sp. NVP41]
MAGCYSSSASAPLHALANQFLGESSFSAKSSLFRPSHSSSRYHPGHIQAQAHRQGLFPRQQQHHHHHSKHQLTSKQKAVDDSAFEHAWSSQQQEQLLRHHYQSDPWATQFNNNNNNNALQRPIPNQRHLQDLDLISSWDHAAAPYRNFSHSQEHQTIARVPQELSTEEFDAFYYQPSEVITDTAPRDSLWAQEMVQDQTITSSTTLLQGQQAKDDDDDDDDEDEFREEWNNDHFTQAYINSHQSQFRQIEEQDRLKEARLAEEREKQRQQASTAAASCPPRSSSSWMMTGVLSPSTAMETMTAGPRRLRLPGLDPEEDYHYQQSHPGHTGFSVSEFESFNHDGTSSSSNHPSPYYPHQEFYHQPPTVKPIRAEDRFLSLVSDLHLAEQTYYPPASSATLPNELDEIQDFLPTTTTAAKNNNYAWVQEFNTTTTTTTTIAQHQQQTLQKFLGAEWNWEKLFGKDPRKQIDLSSTTVSGAGGSAAINESERLKAVALARLQALLGHLSLAPSQSVP